jgi:non-specific serine/threonine protein kinase
MRDEPSRNVDPGEVAPGSSPTSAPAAIVGAEAGAYHHLPSRLTSFVGRERELAELERLSGMCRLLTLTGPGGCGKTRLALKLADRLAPTYPDGVHVVSLAPIADPGLVTSAVADVLGVHEAIGEPLSKTLARVVGERRMLLVLDNFEHLVPAAPVIADLLSACPHLLTIVTSRELLRLQGEQVFPVPPLTLPDRPGLPSSGADVVSIVSESEAGRLFVDRARSAQPDFRLDPSTALAVREICVRLDGLPLALELAAASVRLLSPQAMVGRLARRLPHFPDGARDLPARQRTLRGAITWSYDLLEEHERVMFRRLAIFVGGCTLEAAEAVGGADDGAGRDHLGVITSLLDKSLLRRQDGPDGEPRFAMLETIREYGLEQLQVAGEDISVRRRHLGWLAEFAERCQTGVWGPEGRLWLDRLAAELDNFRAALAWSVIDADRVSARAGLRTAGALHMLWFHREYLSEGLHWLERTLAADQEQSDDGHHGDDVPLPAFRTGALGADPRVSALNSSTIVLGALWRPEQAGACAEEAVALARVVQDRIGEANALLGLAHDLPTSESRRAIALLEQSVSIARSQGDAATAWRSLRNLGWVLTRSGDYERARLVLEESLAVARASGGLIIGVSWSLRDLGELALHQGDLDRASQLMEESLGLAAQMRSTQSRFAARMILGRIALARGDARGAAEYFIESLPLTYHAGRWLGFARCLEGLATAVATEASGVSAASALGVVQLLGAATVLREEMGRPAERIEQSFVERTVAALKASLGEDAFLRGWAEGRALTSDQAYTLAFETASLAAADAPSVDTPGRLRDAQVAGLSPREQEVAVLVAEGLSNPQIAQRLGLSDRTIDAHLRNIMGKLDVTSRAQVAAWSVRHGPTAPTPDG